MPKSKKSPDAKLKMIRRQQRIVTKAIAFCGSQSALSDRSKGAITRQQVSHWMKGLYLVSPECAIKIERATGGEVSRELFHPHLYKGFVRVEQQKAAA